MFGLTDQPCKIKNYNARSDTHGKNEVPAADIKFETLVHSSLLDSFDPTIRPFLFAKNDTSGDQPPLVDGDPLTKLDKPHLKPLESGEKFPGYTLKIGSGLDIAEPLELTEVTLSHWKIEPRRGGAVLLTFSATFKPDTVSAGVLSTSVKKVVHITAKPPTVDDKQASLV